VATLASSRRRGLGARFGVRQALVALVALQALVLWLLARTSFWRTDDWIYLNDLHQRGRWSHDWLFSIWWKHIAPLHRAMFSLFDKGTPATYTGALLFEIALVAIAAFGLYAIMELLFGRSWWLLIPVAVFGFSLQLALPLVWPSSGFQAMPETAASIVCTYFWLRHLHSARRGPRAAWLVAAAIMLGVGLCFYIRPLLLLPMLVVLRILFLEPSLRPSAVLRALWREKVTWAVLAIPIAIFVAVYLHRHAFGQRQPIDFNDLQHYVREAWFRNLFPGLLGVREYQGALDAPHLLAEVVAQLLLAGLVALSLYRKGLDALRGWGFMLFAVALTFALTATGKLAETGVSIGLESRYVTNLTWLVPLGVVMALYPGRVARLGQPWPAGAGLRPLPSWAPRAGAAAAGVATVAACALGIGASYRIIDEWGAKDGRTWMANVRSSARALAADGTPPHVPDIKVPGSVVDNAFVGDSWSRAVLPWADVPLRIGAPYDALYTEDGTIVPAALHPQQTLSLRRLGGRATLANLQQADGCLVAPAAGEGILEWPLATPATGQLVIASLPDGTAVPPTGFGLDIDSGYGLPSQPQRVIPPYGPPSIDTGETKVVRIRLHVPAGQRLCADAVTLSALDRTGG
jgi:hypothetical protein